MARSNSKPRSLYDIERAKVVRARRKALQVNRFTPEEKCISRRIAEFLNWCADKYPKCIITYEEITQAIFSLGKKPSATSKQVRAVSKAVARARSVSTEKYRRDIVTLRGVGARATTDSADVVLESVSRDVRRHQSTATRLKHTAELVDDKEFRALIAQAPDDIKGDLQAAHEWFTEYLQKYIKVLDKPNSMRALLPPPPPTG